MDSIDILLSKIRNKPIPGIIQKREHFCTLKTDHFIPLINGKDTNEFYIPYKNAENIDDGTKVKCFSKLSLPNGKSLPVATKIEEIDDSNYDILNKNLEEIINNVEQLRDEYIENEKKKAKKTIIDFIYEQKKKRITDELDSYHEKEKQKINDELNSYHEKQQTTLNELKEQQGAMMEEKKKMELTLQVLNRKIEIAEKYNNLIQFNKNENTGNKQSREFNKPEDFTKFISDIKKALDIKYHLYYNEVILKAFFLGLLNDDLILLTGESGTGKSSLATKFVELIGGKSYLIPVKPNWTEPQDLIGYFNPFLKEFISTPFTEALQDANMNQGIIHLVALDEMNLARVEYYFSDILSKKESDNNRYVDLPIPKNYTLQASKELLKGQIIKERLQKLINSPKEEYNFEAFMNELDEIINTNLIQNDISNNPASRIPLGGNLYFAGTVNIDETTYYFSDKVLDRSMVLKFVYPDNFKLTLYKTNEEALFDNLYLANDILVEIKNRKLELLEEELEQKLNNLNELNNVLFKPLGIGIGYRVWNKILNFIKLSSITGLFNIEEAITLMIITKILPKLRFTSMDLVNTAGIDKKKDLFDKESNKIMEICDRELAEKLKLEVKINRIKKNGEEKGLYHFWS